MLFAQNSYDDLYQKIEEYEGYPRQTIYLNLYLEKAKAEGDLEEMVNGYRNFTYYRSEKTALAYGDSMVWVSLLSQDDPLKANAHLSKGILFYKYKRYSDALACYLIADSYLQGSSDEYLVYKTRYNIAQIKNFLGFHSEAIGLYQSCIQYFKYHNDRGYINSLHGLALCYSRMGEFNKSNEIIIIGIAEAKRLSIQSMDAYFKQLSGINHSYMYDLHSAIQLLESSLVEIEKKNDFANASSGHFYLGKNYWTLNQKEKAQQHFQEVDQIFSEQGYMHPDLRETYQFLGMIHAEKEDLDKMENILVQIGKVDNYLQENFQYLSSKLHVEFDQTASQKENQALKKSLKQNQVLVFFLVLVFIVLWVFLVLYIRPKKDYVGGIFRRNSSPTASDEKNAVSLPTLTLLNLKDQLEKFEKSEKYLKKDWNQAQLAAEFNSNVVYMKSAIQTFRNKGFSDYINDLRIDHLIRLAERDSKLKYYDNKSLAQEVGFSTTDRFTKAFKSRMGTSPSEYFRKLREKSED
ncbi:helix-turn-helix domain-containing protein [Moheibacter lacus]|uniref:Helix-turn-helix domain-containing protein n=1 Tax=Moheibacter lacus TaxID=2745851 RepID=A0A838ZNR8_9FLAO|nr:helix-turn-helix domain-containing protein [Moheibacter lacus]MBA5628927.1 helix-turn-helix domain-containing protein [Moheibacter lacus]